LILLTLTEVRRAQAFDFTVLADKHFVFLGLRFGVVRRKSRGAGSG
jgi:hypothetical protein